MVACQCPSVSLSVAFQLNLTRQRHAILGADQGVECMLPTNLKDLTPTDIQNLIDGEVAENLTLEYKEALPTGCTDDKREFLYDVTAMANQAGGDFVFGLVDRRGEDGQSEGIPERLAGMKLSNVQTEIARLSNLIKDGIAPRLAGVAMQSVTCPDGDALVIRVPQSWNRPHLVAFGGANKFYGRVSTGKYPMSVEEIGRAFSERRELHEAIEHWRAHRTELASLSNGPVPMASEVTMLFHVMPASAFNREVLRHTWIMPPEEKLCAYVPNGHGAFSHRYNADGFLATAQISGQAGADGYTQLFRSGIIEYADSRCYWGSNELGPTVRGQELEKQMVHCYEYAINRIRKEGQSGVLYVGFSLIGIAGKLFYSTMTGTVLSEHHGIRKDIFISPEVFVDINEPEDHPYRNTLLPLVDTMWQVAGREGTPFKSGGLWEPFKQYE